jgi:hypothetical protein
LMKFLSRQLEALLKRVKHASVMLSCSHGAQGLRDGEVWLVTSWVPSAGVYTFRACVVKCIGVAQGSASLQEVMDTTGFAPSSPDGQYFQMHRRQTATVFQGYHAQCSAAFGDPFRQCWHTPPFDFLCESEFVGRLLAQHDDITLRAVAFEPVGWDLCWTNFVEISESIVSGSRQCDTLASVMLR